MKNTLQKKHLSNPAAVLTIKIINKILHHGLYHLVIRLYHLVIRLYHLVIHLYHLVIHLNQHSSNANMTYLDMGKNHNVLMDICMVSYIYLVYKIPVDYFHFEYNSMVSVDNSPSFLVHCPCFY